MTSLTDEELVLLTSYFNLSNGRRQDTSDTFRVDPNLPSNTSPSGAAALYIITEASGGSHMGPRARRLAADTIAWEYSTHGHEPPARRLKAAILTAHQEVYREFDGHVAVGVSVIAVEHNDVYLAQVAPAQVYVLHDGKLHSNSPDAPSGPSFSRSIGADRPPAVTLARDEIAEGDVLAICSSWFERSADQDDVRACFELGSAEDISAGLFDLCERHSAREATAIVIEAVREAELHATSHDEEFPGGFLEQLDSAVQALANVGRMLAAELRPEPDETRPGRNGRTTRSELAELDDPLGSPEAIDQHLEISPYDDTPDRPIPPRRDTRRSRLWRSTARQPSLPADQITGEFPAASFESEGDQTSWDDDPFATREVPAVPPASQSQVADPWNPEKTTTYDLGELQGSHPVTPPEPTARRREPSTEEVPAISPEAWMESPESEPSAEFTAPESYTPGEFEADADVIAEPDLEAEERPHFTRRRPRRPFRQEPSHRVDPVDEPVSDTRAQAEIDEVNSRIHDDLDMSEVIPPVQGFADSGTEPSRIYATSKDIQAVNRRPRRFGGIGRPEDANGAPRVVRPAPDLNLRQPVSRPAPNAVIWFAAAAVCVFALIAAVYALKHFSSHHTATNPYPAAVRRDIRNVALAKGFDAQDRLLVRARLNLALAKQNGTPATIVRQLRGQIATTTDTVFGISRVAAPVVVGKFQQPSEIATGTNNLYVLDSGKGGLFSVQQNSTAAPSEIVTSGETDGGAVLGKLTQLATAGTTSLVLDNNNILVRDDGTTKTATLLSRSSPTQKVAGMINSGTDVYLLDPPGSQVWKYAGAVTTDNPAPIGLLAPGSPNLNKAVSFTMDDTAMYILESNGTVLKFDLSGHQQSFKLSLHTPLSNPVSIFTDYGLHYIWIADPGAGRIVQVDKSGNYIRSYASSAATSMDLKQLKSIAVPPDGKSLYALAGTQVFRFDIKP